MELCKKHWRYKIILQTSHYQMHINVSYILDVFMIDQCTQDKEKQTLHYIVSPSFWLIVLKWERFKELKNTAFPFPLHYALKKVIFRCCFCLFSCSFFLFLTVQDEHFRRKRQVSKQQGQREEPTLQRGPEVRSPGRLKGSSPSLASHITLPYFSFCPSCRSTTSVCKFDKG